MSSVADEGDEVGCIDGQPLLLGGFDELENQSQGGRAAGPCGDRRAQAEADGGGCITSTTPAAVDPIRRRVLPGDTIGVMGTEADWVYRVFEPHGSEGCAPTAATPNGGGVQSQLPIRARAPSLPSPSSSPT
ncbi:hypothetical protein TNCT6_71390 [Streptomyces sp. 6-11-2]|nr:hypothetical protein TNCT6_71390 [Streptomyces sp. 6-11-2]